MKALERALYLLSATMAICALMFVGALVFSTEFRDSSVATPIGAVLGTLGTAVGALAGGAFLTRDVKGAAEEEKVRQQQGENVDGT